jgi:uncharacterized protein HemX
VLDKGIHSWLNGLPYPCRTNGGAQDAVLPLSLVVSVTCLGAVACAPITDRLDLVNAQLGAANQKIAVSNAQLRTANRQLKETNDQRLRSLESKLDDTNRKLQTVEEAIKRIR